MVIQPAGTCGYDARSSGVEQGQELKRDIPGVLFY